MADAQWHILMMLPFVGIVALRSAVKLVGDSIESTRSNLAVWSRCATIVLIS